MSRYLIIASLLLAHALPGNPGPVLIIGSKPDQRFYPLPMISERVEMLLRENDAEISGEFQFAPREAKGDIVAEKYEVRVPVVCARDNVQQLRGIPLRGKFGGTSLRNPRIEVNKELSGVIRNFDGYAVYDCVYTFLLPLETPPDGVVSMEIRYPQGHLVKDGVKYFLYLPVFQKKPKDFDRRITRPAAVLPPSFRTVGSMARFYLAGPLRAQPASPARPWGWSFSVWRLKGEWTATARLHRPSVSLPASRGV